ncbi:MAG: alpha/beta hydrolase [Anaerolineales bacterium]
MTWSSSDVVANGLRLHYYRTGGAKPPLVLCHGFSDDGLCWTPVARALEADYDIIMMDSRGHGLSDAPESGYGTLDLAQDLAAAIRALSLERPIVMGHSMGGGTTLALAGLFPELPRAVVVEDSGIPRPGAARADRDPAWRERQRAQLASFAAATREELIARCHAESPTWSQEELGPWADAKKRLSPNVLNRADAAPVDWQTLLPRITCPALLITADPERGSMVTVETAREMQALVPQLRVEHIAGAGHNIRREQFDRYVEVVRAFLAELPA